MAAQGSTGVPSPLMSPTSPVLMSSAFPVAPLTPEQPHRSDAPKIQTQKWPAPPATAACLKMLVDGDHTNLGPEPPKVCLDLADGSSYTGYSFGADKTVAGELVFQTGMVGYPESITDPSYRGQILVITFPLVGNYGVPSRETYDALLDTLPAHFEALEIHVAGLVVSSYYEDFSHYLATSSLGDWLKEQGVPAIYGVDTRAITKKIRTQGVMMGRLLQANKGEKAVPAEYSGKETEAWRSEFEYIPFSDPNTGNLVADVSVKETRLYKPDPATALKHPSGRTLRVLCVDVGMKYNQIRCFVHRGVELKVVPWNADFNNESEPYDGFFISNGPGDPAVMKETVEHIRTAMESKRVPMFGICLGHQLMSRAAGAETIKLKFGNRGHNIPCTNLLNGRCYITSQNHGYAVDAETLPAPWKPLFINANDSSNEGVYNTELPYFSVQFHPESTPGPRDTEFLFDVFINSIVESAASGKLVQMKMPGGTIEENVAKYPRVHPKKVLVLGSGGLSIGQAGEFDYSGSQAIKALKEEGIYTILINPNIATIQTSKGLADKVYFLPVTPDYVRKVIKHERPDAIYCTFGGQTALSVGIALKDEFEGLGVKVLGTPIQTVIVTEDRELFANALAEINEKCAQSEACNTTEEAISAANNIGYPLIIRAAYALGGLGSGFADNEQELVELCAKAFANSPQVLVEKSMKGWKEIEYEVVRDCRDNCITVCNMENFDPLGIHTGDSIVVAPSQTLSDDDYNMLRDTATSVIRHLGVVGECNIQYALNPVSKEYCIIEVNARLSRSSALASKATGYPLAFVAAKLGLGIPLNEVKNSVTKVTVACFEPSLDYCVVKMPRWDLKKFTRVSTQLSSAMKSVGEVMSIGRTFEEAMQKAIRAVDYSNPGFTETPAFFKIDQELQFPSDQRLFAVANAMHAGYTVDRIWELTRIDKWFLNRLMSLVTLEKTVRSQYNFTNVPLSYIRRAKQMGFSDKQLASMLNSNEQQIRRMRVEAGITPFVKQIDTVAAEFPAFTNYLYVTYNASEHDITFEDRGVMVLGSGVYRIGSSVEFDWCAVRTVRTLREHGVKTIMVNYNPETVSTDYDEADRLYFENIDIERVLDIYELEQSAGVVGSMGGQTPNNIALALHRLNVKMLGTSPENIDTAENRFKFSRMLDRIGVDQPLWKELTSFEEAREFANRVTYPVLVRPSYVLSGAAMNTVWSEDDLENYLKQAAAVSKEYPVVITKYIENAKEIEMDAVAKDGKMIFHVISEHIENAGVHSGDATLVLPPQDLDPVTMQRITEATAKIGYALNITGPYNIQFIAKDNDIKVIECNVRASRSFPFVSKVMGVDLIEMATKAMMGLPVSPYPKVELPKKYVAVKVPQFSFSRLAGADPVLGVEMASTGEVACFGADKYEAYLKGLISTGFKLPKKKNVLLSIGSFREKMEMLASIKTLHKLGFTLHATAGTADFIKEHGLPVRYLEALPDSAEQNAEYSLNEHLANNLIDLYINLPSSNRFRRPASYTSTGYRTRRMAVDFSIPLVTNVKNAKILIEAFARRTDFDVSVVDFQSSHQTLTLPGFINVAAFVPGLVEEGTKDFEQMTKASVAAGFTMARVMPLGAAGSIEDAKSLAIAQRNAQGAAHCDFNFSVAATSSNTDEVDKLAGDVGSLFIPFNHLSGNVNKVAAVASHFGVWPESKPIVSDAKATDLASILLLASLQSRPVHITNVTTKDDMALISLAKSKGLNVTCDVSVYALFLSQKDYPEVACLPTEEDQEALWKNIADVDCFSIGSLPYHVAHALNKPLSADLGIAEALPLLLGAVAEGKLSMDDVTSRFYYKPKAIFDLHDQPDSSVTVEADRKYEFKSAGAWSPFEGRKVAGKILNVQFESKAVFQDGSFTSAGSNGKDMSASVLSKPTVGTPARARKSVSREALGASPILAAQSHLEAIPTISSALSGTSSLKAMVSNTPFFRKNVISVKQFNREALHLLFSVAQEIRIQVERYGVLDLLQGRVLATMFYEPSTRTSASFDAAMQRLGGKTLAITASASSVAKGESLADTIRTLSSYSDAIVLRHPSAESAATAAKSSPVPIINAGNGSVEHPTQAFTDLFTIREELGTVNGLTITFVGDLRYGRTIHSLIRLLSFYHVNVNLVSPPALRLPADLVAELNTETMTIKEHIALSPELVASTDVLYVTRVQGERFESPEEYETLKDTFIVDNAVLKNAKQHMIVMHPLPRNAEISGEVDGDHRAAYFRQMRYGMYTRMALLACVLGPMETN
ncbi:Carbamoyl-phosphate synthase [Saitoella coloradoensis]